MALYKRTYQLAVTWILSEGSPGLFSTLKSGDFSVVPPSK
jgi:hypothetical protein